jgi:hypothetical protein
VRRAGLRPAECGCGRRRGRRSQRGGRPFGIDVKPRQKRLERNRRGDIPALLREHLFERRLGLERRGERVTPVDLEGAGQPRLQSQRRRPCWPAPSATDADATTSPMLPIFVFKSRPRISDRATMPICITSAGGRSGGPAAPGTTRNSFHAVRARSAAARAPRPARSRSTRRVGVTMMRSGPMAPGDVAGVLMEQRHGRHQLAEETQRGVHVERQSPLGALQHLRAARPRPPTRRPGATRVAQPVDPTDTRVGGVAEVGKTVDPRALNSNGGTAVGWRAGTTEPVLARRIGHLASRPGRLLSESRHGSRRGS